MKLTIGTLALALLATAAIARNHASQPVAVPAIHQAMSAHLPVPMCPLNDPHGCGIDRW
jgi:hypothetical protein